MNQTSDLTARQKEVFDWIRGFVEVNGYAPTYREIMDEFGFTSLNASSGYLKVLVKKGFIEHDGRRSRSIRIVGSGHCLARCEQLLRLVQGFIPAEQVTLRAEIAAYFGDVVSDATTINSGATADGNCGE